MKVSCLQMNMKLGCSEENFAHAEQLIRNAMKDTLDVLVLPETWNIGFFPKENLAELSCKDGDEVLPELLKIRCLWYAVIPAVQPIKPYMAAIPPLSNLLEKRSRLPGKLKKS